MASNKKTLNESISIVNDVMKEILASENKDMQEVMDWVLSNKGKQLRPKMMLMGSMFGKKKDDNLYMYAAMIEIIHMASLVHDDIIDNADMRRGILSVQKKFGKKMAVYAGDYMIYCVVDKAAGMSISKYRKIFDNIRQMCYGELGQNSALYNIDITIEEYISNITGKTACIFESACQMGGLISSAPSSVVSALADFGRNFGILFQIRDDLLDFCSSEDTIGKPVLQDFENGIYTLPVIYSMDTEEHIKQMKEIKESVSENGMTEDNKKALFRIIEEAHGLEKARYKADEYYTKANISLGLLPDIPEKQYLSDLLFSCYSNL